MADENPSAISHISLGTNDLKRAGAFYDAVLAPLGIHRIAEEPGMISYGKAFPEFFLHTPIDGKTATVGNGTHIGFYAESKEAVDAFHKAGLAAGAKDEGAPGPRPHYSDAYYGGFLRDPDGHKIEATFFDVELAKKLGMF